MYRILLVEDDLENCEILSEYLLLSGRYETTVVHDAQSAIEFLQKNTADLILMDILLPGMDGIELCSRLRRMLYCPIIFISCLADDETVIRAMKMGGDDYLTKPFRYAVLEAHIEAVLRRMHQSTPCFDKALRVGNMVLSTTEHTLEKDGELQYLSPTEYNLLMCFVNNANTTLRFEEIYQQVWRRPSYGDLRTVFSHVHNLRKKLENDPANPYYIKTVPRIGYMFCIKDTAVEPPKAKS